MRKGKTLASLLGLTILASLCPISAFSAGSSLAAGESLELDIYRGSPETVTVVPTETAVYRLYTTGAADTECTLYSGEEALLYNDDSPFEPEVPNCAIAFLGVAGREYRCDIDLTAYHTSDYGATTVHLEQVEAEALTTGKTIRRSVTGVVDTPYVQLEQYDLFTPEESGSYTFTLTISAPDCNEMVCVYDSSMNLLLTADHYYEGDERTGTNTFSLSLNAGETYLLASTQWIYSSGNVILSSTVTRDADQSLPDHPKEFPDQKPGVITPPEDYQPPEPEWSNPFVDVTEGKWYYEAVRYCCLHGLFNGTSETTFEPNTPMTRGMLVKVLYSMSGVENYPVSFVFDDVTPTAWYAQAVSWAYGNGVVKGMGDRVFAPKDNLTREQLVQVLYAYYQNYLMKTPGGAADLTVYADWETTGKWAREAMSWAVGNGLVQGSAQKDGSVLLEPKANATRAQVAAIMQRFDNLIYG